MIYHDTVEVWTVAPFNPPQYDEFGNEIFDETHGTVRAEVFPVGVEELSADAAVFAASTRYRMVLDPAATIPATTGDDRIRFGWGAYPVDPAEPFGPTSGLRLDGAVERHLLRGRLHHYELITKSVE